MPLTFGAGTGDDVNASLIDIGPSNLGLFFGWFYPTTLTAGRGYFGWADTTTRVIISSAATDRIRVQLQRVTTDRVVDFNSAGIVTNAWQWICILLWGGTTTVWNDPLCWVGTESKPPVNVGTATQVTAGAGNAQASGGTTVTIGNTNAAATNAFQGDICHFGLVLESSGAVNTLDDSDAFTGIQWGGSVDTATNAALLQRLLIPLWAGRYEILMDGGLNPYKGPGGARTQASSQNVVYLLESTSQTNPLPTCRSQQGVALTINGATTATRGAPRRSMGLYPGRTAPSMGGRRRPIGCEMPW